MDSLFEESEVSSFVGKVQYIEPDDIEYEIDGDRNAEEVSPHITVGILGKIDPLTLESASKVLGKLIETTKLYSAGISNIRYIVYKPAHIFNFKLPEKLTIGDRKIILESAFTHDNFLKSSTKFVILHDITETSDNGYNTMLRGKNYMTFCTGNLSTIKNNVIKDSIGKFKSSCPKSSTTVGVKLNRPKILTKLFKLIGRFDLPLSVLFVAMKHLDNYSAGRSYKKPSHYEKIAIAALYVSSNSEGYKIDKETFLNTSKIDKDTSSKIFEEFTTYRSIMKEYITRSDPVDTTMDYIIYLGGGLNLTYEEISLALYFAVYIMLKDIGDCSTIANTAIYSSLKKLRCKHVGYSDSKMVSRLTNIESRYMVDNIGDKILKTPNLRYLNSYFASTLFNKVSSKVVPKRIYNQLYKDDIRLYLDSQSFNNDSWRDRIRYGGWYDIETSA